MKVEVVMPILRTLRSLAPSLGALALTASVASAQQPAIRIGTAAPLSGAQAFFGEGWHKGIKMYFDEANAAGGISGRKIELVQQDDKADPREGTLVAQKFCDDRAMVAVIAHFNSGVTLPSLDVYSGCGMPQVTISSNPKVTQLGFKHVFRVSATDDVYGTLPAKVGVQKLGLKSAIVVHDKQAFGQGIAEIFGKAFQDAGGKVLTTQSVDPKDVDFGPIVARIKRDNPDAVYFGGVMPQLALLAKQMREQGVSARYFVPDGAYTPDFVSQGGSATEGTYVSFDAPPYDSTESLKKFAANFKAKFGSEAGPYSAYGYQQAWVMAEALKRSAAANALTRGGVMEALRKTDLKDGVLGDLKFDSKGDIQDAGIFIYLVKGGKFEIFHSPAK
jgi:branched-chain amino acid transport system substrate-binding protein